ncbi:MAG: hypothetical protein GY834_12735, partial [Bacteroidetes bacterium]|nr:hypothetical protein [Bacteroidota bacterium]
MTPDIDVLFKGDSGTVTLTDYGQLIATGKGKIKSNSAIGFEALNANTTGNSNTATGFNTLLKNTTGMYNTATGTYALGSNIDGKHNTAIGANALYRNTEGVYNTATGNQALYKNTLGNNNTALGYDALGSNSGGSYNVALGYQAGKGGTSPHNKSGGVFLGYQAGYFETGDNKLYIDNSDTTAPLIYGDFEADSLRINGDLKISGTLKIEGGDPEVGYVLTSNANGLASWRTPTGGTDTLGLAGVSSASTDTTKSTYTMTPGIDVLFKGVSGAVMLTNKGQLIATGTGKDSTN